MFWHELYTVNLTLLFLSYFVYSGVLGADILVQATKFAQSEYAFMLSKLSEDQAKYAKLHP